MDAPARSGPTDRAAYRSFRTLDTRWADNDSLGHVNNATYYEYFDTAVTAFLVNNRLLGLTSGPMWMVAETGCRFFSEVAFPEPVEIGLRIARLGTTSVRWELGLFRTGAARASATGLMVHVHVDRQTRRPVPIPAALRGLFDGLLAPETTRE